MRTILASLALLLALPLSACDKKAPDDHARSVFDDAPADSAAPGAKTGELPPGHPPMGGKAAAGMPGAGATGGPKFGVPPPAPGVGTGKLALTWTLPKGWTEVKPSNAMRRAQFEVKAESGDAECVVFYFGPGQGGDPLSNARRWADQFVQPDGTPSSKVMKTSQRKAGEIEILVVEVTGAYGGGMRGGAPKDNQMLLGAVASGPDAPWFFKFTGPKATIEQNRKAFEALLDSLKPGT